MGSDDYHFSMGDGVDTLAEGDRDSPLEPDPDSTDRIVFDASVTRDDVTLLRDNDGALTLTYGNDNIVTIAGQFTTGGDNIEAITFADGQQITQADLNALTIGQLDGTTNGDRLYGSSGSDLIRGYAGADTLDGARRLIYGEAIK